tara:strand:+ start:1026 stop:2918 length:1893 start_codon:yes stop_codon:yes gene_type:complete
MQFYRDGYRPGNPDILPPDPRVASRPASLPDHVDVLIVGTGPAGTLLGAQLAAFPGIHTRIIERRDGPLEVGHADGIAQRTVEVFETLGLAQALVREAYWVNEIRFWGPASEDRSRIVRTGRVPDAPEGQSEFPHVIVNQARMQQYLLDHMAASAAKLGVDYGIELVTLRVDEGEFPVVVTLRQMSGPEAGSEATLRAKYVVGCDGARSAVRRAIGRELRGDAANHAWGVMDILATTDFPDWRTKNVIQSAGKGTLLMIPREGGNMVRCYVDLGEVAAGDSEIRKTSVHQLTEIANGILHPYSIEVKSVAWNSVYEVGQRITDKFDDVPADAQEQAPRVFIMGDACHTHSAKAGQGLNVSIQDAFNLGWKLAAVLEGRSEETLLHTYSAERQAVAQDLIEFDKYWSALIAQPIRDPDQPDGEGVTTEQMQEEYARQGRYTAGLATRYTPSILTASPDYQHLAPGFEIGTRFHSAPVIRVSDARRMHLGHVHQADGRWRLYLFGDVDNVELEATAVWLTNSADSPIPTFTPADADADSVFDVHGIYRCAYDAVDLTALAPILLPRSGPLGLQDWEKVWAIDPAIDIFTSRGVSKGGAIVVVRPDQYVAHVLPLSSRTALTGFFEPIMRRRH